MMRKVFITFSLIALYSINFYGQVGINTTNPQELVHVAGSTENVRVEGLSYPHNSNNLGPESTTRVYVNSLGNLVLGTADDAPPLFIDSPNYLEDQETPENIVIQVGHGFGYKPTASPIDWPNYVFTLVDTAIVEINYSVSWTIYNEINDERKRIDDNRSRAVHTGVYFMDITDLNGPTPYRPGNTPVVYDADNNAINGGPWCIDPVSLNNCNEWAGLVGLNGQYYANSESRAGVFAGRTNGSYYVKLPPGDYLAMFACKLEVEDTNGNGAAKLWVGRDNDELQIRIYPIQN